MRNQDLIKHFTQGGTSGKGSNLYIEDNDLINYSTIIARRRGNIVLLNNHSYSPTTSKNQTYVRYYATNLIECPVGMFGVLCRDSDKLGEVISAFENMPGVSSMSIR